LAAAPFIALNVAPASAAAFCDGGRTPFAIADPSADAIRCGTPGCQCVSPSGPRFGPPKTLRTASRMPGLVASCCSDFADS
jgi:hypothetical protein